MYRTANRNSVLGFAVTTAMAGALLTGCSTASAPPAALSASKAEAALARGKAEQAIAHAEAAVQAEPRNAAYRATLGTAYLDAGRFASAATSFDDAMQLGDNSARTALSLALALTGEGKRVEAAALLNDWEGEIATADLGLALALAGQPERGIHLMGNAIRSGDNTAKMRQNLAYAYALAGRWREARLMAQQDVPADQVGARMEQWALMTHPDAAQTRVAAMLDVPTGVADAGQPAQLALANNPSLEQLAAEASAATAPEVAAAPPPGELPAVGEAEPTVNLAQAPAPAPVAAAPRDFQSAFAAPVATPASAVRQDGASFAPPRAVRTPEPVRTATVAAASEDTHLVQLGSFASEQGARRAWGIYVKKYPELSGHQMVISEAVVRGKHYWRVSAAGYGRSTASAMCGRVKGSGEGCFAYAEGRPLPGAIDTGVRLARR
jgi:Flp pilus assembly protein TadD